MEKEFSSSAKYYLILKRIVGRESGGGYSIFRHGQWEPDTEWMIMDRLMGYDPSEPPDSPYGIGNTAVMDEIEEITCQEAVRYTGGKT